MPEEQPTIRIMDIPALQDIAREVSRTQKRRYLPVDGEDVTIIVAPKRAKRSPSKARPLTEDDALFALVGIGKTGIPSNASEEKHEAFDEAYRGLHDS